MSELTVAIRSQGRPIPVAGLLPGTLVQATVVHDKTVNLILCAVVLVNNAPDNMMCVRVLGLEHPNLGDIIDYLVNPHHEIWTYYIVSSIPVY